MYSSLLTGYGRAADKDKLETKESFSKVDAVFNDMRAAGVKPDVAVYNAYIMAACRCEKWLAAVQVRRANERRAFICPACDLAFAAFAATDNQWVFRVTTGI